VVTREDEVREDDGRGPLAFARGPVELVVGDEVDELDQVAIVHPPVGSEVEAWEIGHFADMIAFRQELSTDAHGE